MDLEDLLNILEPRMGRIETESCEGCPAFRWVLPGQEECRLGFSIDGDHPTDPCLRPLTVGASYRIAREFGRPEPLVGKLDKWQFEQYKAEKKQNAEG